MATFLRATMSVTRRQFAGVPPSVSRAVGQHHVALALASLTIGLGAVVADKGLSVGLRAAAAKSYGEPAKGEPL